MILSSTQNKEEFNVPGQIERAAKIYHDWQSEGTNGTNYKVAELYRSVGITEIEIQNPKSNTDICGDK